MDGENTAYAVGRGVGPEYLRSEDGKKIIKEEVIFRWRFNFDVGCKLENKNRGER